MKDVKKNASILVVEDDQDAAALLKVLLERAGYTVFSATNAEEGKTLAQEHHQELRLVTVDLKLPGGKDGHDLCCELRSDRKTGRIPIIVISGHASDDDIARSYACGAFQHIEKPFNQQHLMSVVNNIVAIHDLQRDQVTRERDDLSRRVNANRRALEQQDILTERLMDVQRELQRKNAELEDAKKELERLSLTDALTGLHNRRYMDETFEMETLRASRYNHPLSVLMMDIDHFKHINDKYGHAAGDVVLKSLGKLLHARLRETDIAVRYGGEEFLAILPETGMEGAQMIAERMRRAIETMRTLVNRKRIPVTMSIGIASIQSSYIDSKALLAEADNMLYEAKENGRNCVRVAYVESTERPDSRPD